MTGATPTPHGPALCRALRISAALLVCCLVSAARQGLALDSDALPLPYPASYPSENYSPPRVELRGSGTVGFADLNAAAEGPPAPRGLTFGKLLLQPYGTFDASETDNSRRTNIHPKDDELLEYAAGLKTDFRPHECVHVLVNYEFGWHDYVKDTVRDFLSHAAETSIRLDRVGVQGLSLTFSDSYLETGNISPLENEIVEFQRFESNRALAAVEYKFNRFKVSATYAELLTHYFARVDAGSDYLAHSAALESGWQWLPGRLEVFENYQFQRILFDKQPQNDYDSSSILAGARGKISHLNYSLSLGYARADPLRGSQSHSGLGFNASLNYQPHRRLTLELTALRGFQAGVRSGSEIETDLTSVLSLRLTHRGSLMFSYTRNNSDRLDRTQQLSVAYGTRFEYKIARHATLTTAFTRIERSAVPVANAFVSDEVRAGFKLTW